MNGPRACFTCGKGLTRHRLQAHAWLLVIQHDGSGYLFCPGDCADAELDRIDPSDRAYLVMPGPRLVDGLELLAHIIHPGLVDEPAVGQLIEVDIGAPAV